MSFKNILDKSPIQITTAVDLVINLLIILKVFEMDGTEVAALNGALFAVLGLFIANKTANKAVLTEIQEAFDEAEAA